MASLSTDELGKIIYEAGHLSKLEEAIEGDDPMGVMVILQEAGVPEEVIGRMLLELDKEYLLALVDAAHAFSS